MKLLFVDDQFNQADGMPLSSSFDLAESLVARGFTVSYGRDWRLNVDQDEALCAAPREGENGADFLREVFCYSACDADVVILDQVLGEDLRGLHLLKMIRQRDREVPVILMTAFEEVAADVSIAFQAGRAQANHFLPKNQLAEDPDSILRLVKEDEEYQIDRVQQRLANALGFDDPESYDLMECSRLGSVSFFLQEDLAILSTIQSFFGERIADGDILNIVDYGCGTGRFEELLLRKFGPSVRVTGLDFASGMLRAARAKAMIREACDDGQVVLERGHAEYFSLSGQRADFAILGFGFLSYCDASRTLRNLRKEVLAEGGLAFVSFYNAASPYYSVWGDALSEVVSLFKELDLATGEEERLSLASKIRNKKGDLPISTVILPEKSRILVEANGLSHAFPCRPMEAAEFGRLLGANGFEVVDEPHQHISLLGGLSNPRLEHLMMGRRPMGPTRFDDFKDRYIGFLSRGQSGLADGASDPAFVDLTLVEADLDVGLQSNVPGYYTSAIIRSAGA